MASLLCFSISIYQFLLLLNIHYFHVSIYLFSVGLKFIERNRRKMEQFFCSCWIEEWMKNTILIYVWLRVISITIMTIKAINQDMTNRISTHWKKIFKPRYIRLKSTAHELFFIQYWFISLSLSLVLLLSPVSIVIRIAENMWRILSRIWSRLFTMHSQF